MMIRQSRQWAVALVGGAAMTAIFTACDYWPPALQAQIEQLRTEAQTAAADKALLQNQLNAANRAKEELQTRVEDLTRVNKEKSIMIANLERSLAVDRERVARLSKGAPAKTKPAARPPAKPPAKVQPKSSGKPPKKKSGLPTAQRVAVSAIEESRYVALGR